MAATTQKLLTAEDVLDLPDDPRWELIEGIVVGVSPTEIAHVVVASRLNTALVMYSVAHPEVGDVWGGKGGNIVTRDPDSVLAPTLAIVSPVQVEHGSASGRGWMPFAPMIPTARSRSSRSPTR